MAPTRISIEGIQAPDAGEWFAVVRPYIEAAQKRGHDLSGFDAIAVGILAREMQLWVIRVDDAFAGCLVTTIRIDDGKGRLTALIAAGRRMSVWAAAADDLLTRYAQHNGCSLVDGFGRLGWKKSAAHFGWKIGHVEYFKEV